MVIAADKCPRNTIGIDISHIHLPEHDTEASFMAAFESHMTLKEMAWIRSRDTQVCRIQSLYIIWSLKESFVKALGQGMTFGLQRIEFIMPDCVLEMQVGHVETRIACKIDSDDQHDWIFELTFLDSEHVVAITRKNFVQETNWKFLKPSDLNLKK